MLRSLRSRLLVASLLWTGGLLMLMHLTSVVFMHVLPRFGGLHAVGPILIAVGLMAAGIVQLRRGLKPFRSLRDQLLALRAGREQRVAGTYPAEVQPLIDDLNALLGEREQAVKRAVATAGDLAHGLKTPLALLGQCAQRCAAAGNRDIAESINEEVERMTRQVNYHLARARAAASGIAGASACAVAPAADALVRTLLKLYAARSLEISCAVESNICARVQRQDLDEIIGNLLDNACKWAQSRILLRAIRKGEMVEITIDDDGPGLPASVRTVVLERGVRLDERSPGSGLGLAIVRDLAEIYGGSVALDESHAGGLRAGVLLPGASSADPSRSSVPAASLPGN